MARPTLRPIADQVIVITGASSGIGLVTARAAAARGARVVLVARGEEALRSAVAGIEAAGGTAIFVVADVGDRRAVEAAAAAAVARFGRIDTWVNNAGVAIYAPLVDTPDDDHARMIRTNYFGTVNGALAAIPHLTPAGGALITVGSIASQLPSPIMGAYAASKHAVKGYVDALRIELNAVAAPIAVTLVLPAGISTPIAQHAANRQDGEALIPAPLYDPALVADAILDAAEHPRREVTVGGIGRLQVLMANHFPQLLDRFGGLMAPMLRDPGLPRTTGDNLDAPMLGGEERSPNQAGRGFSLYTSAQRHTGTIALVAAAALAGAGALALRRTRAE